MITDFFLGFIRIHILYHASKEPVFGLGLIKELSRHGYHISPGTLYPILHRLLNEKYLSIETKVINGKMRKYYRISAKGKRALKECTRKIHELVEEVLEGR